MKMLPDKPSELIELALADLEKCEADPRHFVIDMGTWCRMPDSERAAKCSVCLAGSVMVQSLDFRFDTDDDEHFTPDGYAAEPSDFREHETKLWSLDAFRVGQIDEALEYLKIEVPVESKDEKGRWRRDMPRYADSPETFKVAMRELAADLKELGL